MSFSFARVSEVRHIVITLVEQMHVCHVRKGQRSLALVTQRISVSKHETDYQSLNNILINLIMASLKEHLE